MAGPKMSYGIEGDKSMSSLNPFLINMGERIAIQWS